MATTWGYRGYQTCGKCIEIDRDHAEEAQIINKTIVLSQDLVTYTKQRGK